MIFFHLRRWRAVSRAIQRAWSQDREPTFHLKRNAWRMWNKEENIPARNHFLKKIYILPTIMDMRQNFIWKFCFVCAVVLFERLNKNLLFNFWSRNDFNMNRMVKMGQFLAARMLSKTNFDIWIRGKYAKTFQRPIYLFVWPRHTQTCNDPVNTLLFWNIFQVALFIGLDWFVTDVVHLSPSGSIVGNCCM